jgi:hypothetical protein
MEFAILLQYSCTTPLPADGVGNIEGPPLFMDLAGGDFRLREDSPCIDAGTNLLGRTFSYVPGTWDPNTSDEIMAVGHITDPTDILGNARFIDGNGDGKVAWDIGAYEFNSFKPPRFNIYPRLTLDGWQLNITGPPNKWVRFQRSSDLKVWDDWKVLLIGAEGVGQATDVDADPKETFYRAVVQ